MPSPEVGMISGSIPTWPMAGATANGGFAAFGARAEGAIHRKTHQPHYQSRDYNPLNGGIARWFDPGPAGDRCWCQHGGDSRGLP